MMKKDIIWQKKRCQTCGPQNNIIQPVKHHNLDTFWYIGLALTRVGKATLYSAVPSKCTRLSPEALDGFTRLVLGIISK